MIGDPINVSVRKREGLPVITYECCPLFVEDDELLTEYDNWAPRLRVEACKGLELLRFELLDPCPVCKKKHTNIVGTDFDEDQTIRKGQLRGFHCMKERVGDRSILLVGVVDQIAEVTELTTIDI